MIKCSVQETIYSGIIQSMQTTNAPWIAPTGPFYLLDGVIVPFSPNPTILRIETDRIGEAITIQIDPIGEVGSGVDIRNRQTSYTVVASSSVVTTGIQLGQGRNLITAQVMNRLMDIDYLIINATTITALWESFARVLYSVSTRIMDEQNRAISSELATRLIEPFISFQELLPDVQSLKVLAIRLVTKGLIHSVGTNLGVTELIKALALTTPIYHYMDKDSYDLFPPLDPWAKSASQFGGKEAHIWLPNVEIASWLAFLGFISNQPDLYEILLISESEVIVKYQGQIQRHFFDFNRGSTSFLISQASSQCFTSIIINVSMASAQTLRMCAATYTFDLYITESNLLGDCRLHLDSPIILDSGCNLDTDSIDPFTDGWINLSLSGRFEQDYPDQHTLDTFIIPSITYSDLCGYDSWYTQLVKNHRYDIEVPVLITVEGYVQEGIAWLLQSPNGNKWLVYANRVTETLMARLVTIPFVGDLTLDSNIITNILSTDGLMTGMGVTGLSIPSNTQILSIDSATQITLTQDATGTLVSNPMIGEATTTISNYKVTKPDLTEAAFAITNAGVLQVVAPSGGETLIVTLYIVSDDETSVWWVQVNNSDILVIEKIFPV